jgi:putative transcriptional regulator
MKNLIEPVKRTLNPARKPRSDALEAAHAAAADLHAAGIIDSKTMHDFDRTCLEPPSLTAGDVKRIRTTVQVSQQMFAAYIGTSKATVQKWEAGKHSPNTMAQRLLRLIDRHGLDILADL